MSAPSPDHERLSALDGLIVVGDIVDSEGIVGTGREAGGFSSSTSSV